MMHWLRRQSEMEEETDTGEEARPSRFLLLFGGTALLATAVTSLMLKPRKIMFGAAPAPRFPIQSGPERDSMPDPPIYPPEYAGPRKPSQEPDEETEEALKGEPPKEVERSQKRLVLILTATGALMLAMMGGELAVRGLNRVPSPPEWSVPGADTQNAPAAIAKYGCGSCHTIPGIPEAKARVGPLLIQYSEQGYIVGRLPNVPPDLVSWIKNPQHFEPGSAMPNLGVTETDARAIADYLYQKSQ